MKFLHSNNYFSEVESLFNNNGELDVAVAFFGIDSLSLLENAANEKVRIICNLESGACNPYLIEKSLKFKNLKIKTNSKLHAKTLIQNDVVIIGSANISANGLSLEGVETKGWFEAGIRTNDEKVINDAKKWYEKLWINSKDISANELTHHKENWKAKRNKRNIKKTKLSLLKAATKNPENFIDREIYFEVHRNNKPSEGASEACEKAKTHHSELADQIDFYEGWSDIPDNAYLISIYVDPQFIVTVDGTYKTPENPLIEKFNTVDDEEAEIKLCFIVDNILGYKLTKSDKDLIEKNIKKLFTCKQAVKDDAFLVPLTEGLSKF